MNPVYYHLYNDEDELRQKYELQLERIMLRDRLDPYNLPDNEFRRLFRLTKDLFHNLVGELGPHLDVVQRSTKLSVECRLLAALRFFATGSYQKGIGCEHNIGIAQQTLSRTLNEICIGFEAIAERWIRFPVTEAERRTAKLNFMQKFNFPGVIDCSLIAILEPVEFEHIYFCRKGYHAKNVLIICDADLLITNINANFGGATHDSFVWRNSAVYAHLQELYGRGEQRTWLLGDSGYPLQPFLMTPIRNTVAGTPERRYDDGLMLARNYIERCIGILKGRFRCLLKERVLRYAPYKVCQIVNACAILHNMCMRANVSMDDDPVQDEYDDDLLNNALIYPVNLLNEGRRQRINLVNTYF